MTLIETQFAARLRLGDAGDVIGELEAAVAAYPYQEGLWELLITALYRAGRQADALAAYQRVRARLADELGLEPGPRLRQLEHQILVHDPALDEAAPAPRREPAVAVGRARRPRGGDRRARRAARAPSGSSRSSGPAGSARRRVAIATGRRAGRVQPAAASGWPGSRPRRRRTTSSTR